MGWVEFVGISGCILFMVKIGVHIYIKRKVDKQFHVGPSGGMLNPLLILPIFDDVTGSLRLLKKAGNVMYLLSLVMLLIFVVALNMH